MPFNNENNGFQNEVDFIKYLNNKKVKDLNIMFQCFIKDLYGQIDYNSYIYCRKNNGQQKADIIIKINSIEKYISIKKGVKNSVHVERITDFIHFLIENRVPKDIVIEYLKYHYADGTTNGIGKNRLSVKEYKKDHQPEIDLINKTINTNELVSKAIDRFVIKGKNSNRYIDAIIYGVIDDFIWIKKNDIKKIILSKINNYSSGVHFGGLSCQPLDRCLNYSEVYNSKRFCVQIKWYNIADDIIESMNNKLMSK